MCTLVKSGISCHQRYTSASGGSPSNTERHATEKPTGCAFALVASDAFRDKMGALNYGVVWAGGEDFTEYLARRGEAFGAAISAAGLGQ